jgi:valyl-tRNA synthetase
MAKITLYADLPEEKKRTVRSVLCFVLERTLCLLHPFMPFITEEIRLKLPQASGTAALAAWPQYDPALHFPEASRRMEIVKEVTRTIRYLRSEVNLPPGKKINVLLVAGSDTAAAALSQGKAMLQKLAAVEEAEITRSPAEQPGQALTAVVEDIEIYLPLAGVIDLAQEIRRLEKEAEKLEKEIARAEGKLKNPGFLQKAPQDVVAQERAKAEEYRKLLDKVEERLRRLR